MLHQPYAIPQDQRAGDRRILLYGLDHGHPLVTVGLRQIEVVYRHVFNDGDSDTVIYFQPDSIVLNAHETVTKSGL